MPFVVTYCAFKIHRASGPSRGQPRQAFTCAQLIDGLGHTTRSATVPVSRSRMQSFQQNRSFVFQARVVLQPLVSPWLVVAADRRTDRQTYRPSTVTLTAHARRWLTSYIPLYKCQV